MLHEDATYSNSFILHYSVQLWYETLPSTVKGCISPSIFPISLFYIYLLLCLFIFIIYYYIYLLFYLYILYVLYLLFYLLLLFPIYNLYINFRHSLRHSVTWLYPLILQSAWWPMTSFNLFSWHISIFSVFPQLLTYKFQR